MITVTLPWPSKDLSPNARGHWAKVSTAKRIYREACANVARSQGLTKIEAKALHLDITFYPPSKRRYDLDNLLASIKSGLDGLCDVVGVDDSTWSLTLRKEKQVGGYIRVVVSKASEIGVTMLETTEKSK